MMAKDERIKLLKAAPPNSWIALSFDESKLVGKGTSYGEAVAMAEASGENDPVLIKTPERWIPMVLPA